MFVATLLLAALPVLWLVLYVMPRRRMTSLTRTIPGPTGLPVLGNCIGLAGGPDVVFNTVLKWHKIYGNVVKVWFGPKLSVVVVTPGDAQCVLNNTRLVNREFTFTSAVSYYLGNGLLTNRDDVWRAHRKLIAPAFHYKVLGPYLKIFQSKAAILVEKLEDMTDGRTVDIHHHVLLCMLDAICETAIGVNMNVQKEGESEFGEAVERAMVLSVQRAFRPWLLLDWLYNLTSDGREAAKVRQTIYAFSEEVIASKLAAYRKNVSNNNNNELKTSEDNKARSFLDTLIEASEAGDGLLTPVEIRDEVSSMAFAGTDTVTNVLSYALVMLGMHPEEQDKIHKELDEVLGDSDRDATVEDIRKMKHLECCIKETLRLFPVASFLPRDITYDLEITEGRVIPAGSGALVFVWGIHRDADLYPEPNSYRPERWTPENSVGRPANAFIPFGSGHRMCVGYKYAMFIMQTVVIALLRRYRVACSSHTMQQLKENITMSVVLKSAVGYKIELTKKL